MGQLSKEAIEDLKLTLKKNYGPDFCSKFTDEELEEVGMLLLTILAEGLKMKVEQHNKNKI